MSHRDSLILIVTDITLCTIPDISHCACLLLKQYDQVYHNKTIPVNKPWSVLRLQMKERPSKWRVAVNQLNELSQTANKGWSFNLGIGRGAKKTLLLKVVLLQNRYNYLGPRMIFVAMKAKERGHEIWYVERYENV
jgi:hypothetical protein